jgi:hypothetical protein
LPGFDCAKREWPSAVQIASAPGEHEGIIDQPRELTVWPRMVLAPFPVRWSFLKNEVALLSRATPPRIIYAAGTCRLGSGAARLAIANKFGIGGYVLILKLSGLLMMGAAGLLFWWLLPKGGTLNRWATMPVIESALPIMIVAGFAVCLCLIVIA